MEPSERKETEGQQQDSLNESQKVHMQERQAQEEQAQESKIQEDPLQDNSSRTAQNQTMNSGAQIHNQRVVPPTYNGKGKRGNKPPKKPMNGWLVAFCVVCGCIAFVMFWGNVFRGIGSSGTSAAHMPVGNTIDVVYVEGTIAEGQVAYNHVWTLNRIDKLMDSDSNKAIMLYVNSPGGGIYESDELYLKLKEYKEETGRPVYAYMAQTAASGGLYVCMAADKIYANRMTLTGSIGVIMSLSDTSKLQDLIGIKTDNIVSGKNKAMGNPLTADQREILQSIIDESYNIFVDVVAEGRKLDKETVKKLADGRVYSPLQAKKLKIIDEVADFDTAVEDLKKKYELEDCELYYDEQPKTFWQEVMQGASNIGNIGAKNDFSAIKSYIDDHSGMKLMYMMNE